MSHLTLKWGTLKGWDFKGVPEAIVLLTEYRDIGSSMSAMAQKDTQRQKEIICKLIDLCDCPEGIYLDWDGKYVTKEEAKVYVLEYGDK